MKNFTLFILCLLYGHSVHLMAQSKDARYPLSDAIAYDTGNDSLKNQILQAYGGIDVFKGNPFIKLPEVKIADPKTAKVFDAQSGGTSVLGGPLIDALGTVVADRFKEELTLAFLDNFRTKLKSDKYYLGKVFPKTRLVLLNDDPFNHKVWLASFRGALDEDLKLLPANLPILLNALKDDERINLSANQKAILETLITAYTPAVMIAGDPSKSYTAVTQFLENAKKIQFTNTDVKAVMTIMHLLTKEMGNKSYNDWTNKGRLENINFDIAKSFIGFTIEKYETELKNVQINGTNLYAYLRGMDTTKVTDFVAKITALKNKIEEIAIVMNDLKALKETKNGQLSYEDYAPLIDKSIDAIVFFTDPETLKAVVPGIQLPIQFTDFHKNAKASVDMAKAVNSYIAKKEYSKIVATTLTLITAYIPQDNLDNSTNLKDFIKYADLAVNMASATNSKEMAEALEGAALPTQSYRLKRNSYFTITLNAYAGGFAGAEILADDDAKNKTSGLAGFTAPVGIGFNWGICTSSKPTKYSKYPTKTTIDAKEDVVEKTTYFNGHSLSLFASVIDIGAVAAFRLTDDETPSGDIQWQNIFAPGAYLIWGIGNTPLALGVGAQYGPQLRSVTAKDGAAVPTIDSRAWRVGLSLTVDIPLFSFFAKTEKVEKQKTEKEKPKQKAEKQE